MRVLDHYLICKIKLINISNNVLCSCTANFIVEWGLYVGAHNIVFCPNDSSGCCIRFGWRILSTLHTINHEYRFYNHQHPERDDY